MAIEESHYEVRGRVTGADGNGLHRVKVIVWWQHIRRRVELASEHTERDGAYCVRYRIPENAAGRVLLVVEANGGPLSAPIESPLTDAQPKLTINLAAQPLDRSELTALTARLTPFLEGLELTDVVENDTHHDVTFLARELKTGTESVMRVLVAARLEAAFSIPMPAFYAFVRQRVPVTIPSPLLDATQGFALIDALVRSIGSLVFALTTDLQTQTLKSAIDKGLIGARYASQIPQWVAALQAQRTTDALAQPYLVGKTSLGQLLTIAQLQAAKQQAFAQALATNTQSMLNFWRTLGDGQHGFTAAEASSIERTLSVGAFVKNHAPLVQLLMQRFSSGTYKQLSDLARLGQSDWIDLVHQVGAPTSIDAAGTASAAEVFARVVYTRVTRAFPTMALGSRVATGAFIPQAERAPLTQFMANNGALELLRANLAAYLQQEGDKAFTGIASTDRAQVIVNVKRLQRVLLVTSNVDAAQTLLGLGLHSAQQISAMGKQQFFLTATAAGITKPDANRIYNVAAARYANTIALYTQLNRDALGVWPKAVGNLSDLDGPIAQVVARDQSLSTLFGSQDYCAVDDCTSILSPAAYLCDLLYWLDHRMTSGTSALSVLNQRRADIQNLKLDCPNTDTALPYIDLVNEILADAISPPTDPSSTIDPPWKQTTAEQTAASLRAAPQYFNQAAYTTLFGASYPHSLPFSDGLDELRTYLQQSNIPLWQLRQALLPLHSSTLAERVAVAAERFGMPPHAVDLATNVDFVPASVAWNTPTPTTDLVPVDAFLQAASLTYEQLLELLQVSWVQGSLGVQIAGVNDSCETDQQTLSPAPDAPWLDRAHRFLRTWRATGYKMWELDLLLRASVVANGTLDGAGLVALGAFRMLQDATKLVVDQQLAMFQGETIDTSTHRDPDGTTTTSLFARVFLTPAVSALDPNGDLAALAAGTAPSDTTLSDHLDAIQAALGISATDASTLVTVFGLNVANTLTLANLSLLYGVTQLAAAAKLSLSDLQTEAQLLAPSSSEAAALTALLVSPTTTIAFRSQATAIEQSGFSIDALEYLLTPPVAAPPLWTTSTGITDSGIATVLGAVRQAILAPSGGDVNGSVIAAVAAQFGLANDVTAFLMQPPPPPVPQLLVPGTGQTLITVLTDASLTSPTGGPYPDLTRANYPDQFVAAQLLDKVALVVKQLHLVLADLTWLLTNTAVYGGLDFTQLPVTASQAALSVSPLLSTALVIKLARLWTSAPAASAIQTLYDIIGGVQAGTIVNDATAQADLATITGWNLADIVAFAGALGLAFPADYTSPATYDALRTLASMLSAVGAKAAGSDLVSWGAVPASEAAAETSAASALGALKALHPNSDEWLAFLAPLTDQIREHRSAALQDYLVGNGNSGGHKFADLDALFDYFLIDTQMSSCEVSTRVVQAYIAVQVFVERCRMGLEAPAVTIDPADDAWNQWTWMKRYRVWEAAREVFLYPENWLVESQRPNRTEIYQKLEDDVQQGDHTADALESVVLDYVDGLDGIAHLFITGMCTAADGTVYVVARTQADPPRYYYRTLSQGTWTGWVQIPLDIKAHQVVPAIYSGRLCIFWTQIKVSTEPHQTLGAAQPSSSPPSQEVSKYVELALYFSIFRNDVWAPAQMTKGDLFDVPLLSSQQASDKRAIEGLYTIKVQSPAPTPGYGASLFIDVFRLGAYDANAYLSALQAMSADYAQAELDLQEAQLLAPLDGFPGVAQAEAALEVAAAQALVAGALAAVQAALAEHGTTAVHIGRAMFDGRFGDLELRNLPIIISGQADQLLSHAQTTYGPDATPLLPLPDAEADPDLLGEPGLEPQAGALSTLPPDPNGPANPTLALNFTAAPLEQNAGPLLNTASVPFRVVGPASDIAFDPASPFIYQDNRRCYYVDTTKWFWTGSTWAPTAPSNPASAPFEARYFFHRFYHPYTRLIWHQLAGGGFPLLYDPKLQQTPDQVDPSHADVFSFQSTYSPVVPRVQWGEDNEILDFSPDAAYSVYNWELFYHVPQYIADLLSQNQQFEDAQSWYHYIFNPTVQGTDPQRFWITKPLHDITNTLSQRINEILQAVNAGDPGALDQVARWSDDPFNPYLLADLRPVAYMKRVVMSYLDNLIAWADNLFASDSREALNEATLLYVIAAEILGPQPTAITPPQHADDSYVDLAPKLDAFANAMVDVENVVGSGSGGGGGGPPPLPAQTFYFKIPPNDQLLGYWSTIADRLFKLRHCQNIQGVTRQLALFDAPIDPGLLVKARAAGVDIGSVLSDVTAALPNYRFTAVYPQALDFVNAVRGYGAALQAALEKSDADHLAVLIATNQQQLLSDADQIFDWQVQLAQSAIDALTEARANADEKYGYYSNLAKTENFANAAEWIGMGLYTAQIGLKIAEATTHGAAAVGHALPNATVGATGVGGTPAAHATEGGPNAGHAGESGGNVIKALGEIAGTSARMALSIGSWMHRQDDNNQKATEALSERNRLDIQIAGAQLALQIAQQNQTNHQTQIDQLQTQIDFLTDRFTNQDLYDWMVSRLADTYFQSYRLAYTLCKGVERCYQYELGPIESDFIQFGYWDSLHKGLLAGEALNHDLRRLQASYLDKNVRRFEMSRFLPLSVVAPTALHQLITTGACDFDLPESLFDHDYPGHYHRHLVRVSVSVVYPSPGKFDNVKATLTMLKNKVRYSTDISSGYAESPVGGDASRFAYNYGAVPQKMVLGQGQDDPGLFLTAMNYNLADPRYMPFEGAGVISSWHIDMPAASNEIDITKVTDVVLHFFYTALYGGDSLRQAAGG